MRSLLVVFEEAVDLHAVEQVEARCGAEVVRFDLAWPLFLPKKGYDEQGAIDMPRGNPRSQWLKLALWVRQTLGGYADMIGGRQVNLVGVLPRSTEAALEYVQRTLSMYAEDVAILRVGKATDTDATVQGFSEALVASAEQFFCGTLTPPLEHGFLPPVVNLHDEPTALLQQMSEEDPSGHYSYLTGLLGSDRLYSQLYRLHPHMGAARLHSHSDVDEMYLVLSGSGQVETAQGRFDLKPGDVIQKPAGSGLVTKISAGAEGLTVLDIEVWSKPDQADVVVYPEHGDVFLRGRGLYHGAPVDTFFSANDIMQHYDDNYRRDKDGKRVTVE